MNLVRFFLSPVGRISRLGMWLGGVLFPIALSCGALLGDMAINKVGFSAFSNPDAAAAISLPLSDGLSWVLIWPMLCLNIKRFHDLNLSGWLYVGLRILTAALSLFAVPLVGADAQQALMLPAPAADFLQAVPHPVALLALLAGGLIALVILVMQLFLPGEPRTNRYGPDPVITKR